MNSHEIPWNSMNSHWIPSTPIKDMKATSHFHWAPKVRCPSITVPARRRAALMGCLSGSRLFFWGAFCRFPSWKDLKGGWFVFFLVGFRFFFDLESDFFWRFRCCTWPILSEMGAGVCGCERLNWEFGVLILILTLLDQQSWCCCFTSIFWSSEQRPEKGTAYWVATDPFMQPAVQGNSPQHRVMQDRGGSVFGNTGTWLDVYIIYI